MWEGASNDPKPAANYLFGTPNEATFNGLLGDPNSAGKLTRKHHLPVLSGEQKLDQFQIVTLLLQANYVAIGLALAQHDDMQV